MQVEKLYLMKHIKQHPDVDCFSGVAGSKHGNEIFILPTRCHRLAQIGWSVTVGTKGIRFRESSLTA